MAQVVHVLHEGTSTLSVLPASLYKAGSESAHLTLQDRFVKGIPLDNMLSIDATDAWLDKFISNFKHRFTRPADSLKSIDISVCSNHLFD